MRVLFFSNEFPNPLNPNKGTFNRSLLRAMAERHAVHVVSPLPWTDVARARLQAAMLHDRDAVQRFEDFRNSFKTRGWLGSQRSEAPRRCESRGLPLVDLSHPSSRGSFETASSVEYPRYFFPPKILRSHYGRFLWWSVGRRLLRAAESFRPDAILSYWAHPDGDVAVRAARQLGIPAVVMVGGTDILLLTKQRRRQAAIRRVLDRADAVAAVSRDIARRVAQLGIPAERIHVVRRGIDRTIFFPKDRAAARQRLGLDADRKVLVSVGRLAEVKGFSVLVEACRHLANGDIPFACYVLGAGPLQTALQRQIDQCGLNGIVRLMGSKQQNELADWYNAADLAVLPSYSEGIPNVLLESISCGTPFVASDVGGVGEIADPIWDRLVEPGDPSELASAIAGRLKEPPPATPRQFEPESWSESAEKLIEIVNKCRKDKSGKATQSTVLDSADETDNDFEKTTCWQDPVLNTAETPVTNVEGSKLT